VDPRRYGGRRRRLQWRRVSRRRRCPVAELELAGCIPAAGVGMATGKARVSGDRSGGPPMEGEGEPWEREGSPELAGVLFRFSFVFLFFCFGQ
jgi:hypothetical protein